MELHIREKPEYNNERVKKLAAMRKEVERWTDGLGEKIDAGIRETVAVLNTMGLSTRQSCEGHLPESGEMGLLTPWVDLEAPNKPKWRYEHEEELRQQVGEKYGIPSLGIYDEEHEDAWDEFWDLLTEQKLTAEFIAWSKEQEKLIEKVYALLDAFYQKRSPTNETRIVIDRNGRMHNGGKFFVHNDREWRGENETFTEEEEKRIPEVHSMAQREMKEFTEFLREKYLNE